MNKHILIFCVFLALFFSVFTRWRPQNPAVRTRHPAQAHPLQHGDSFSPLPSTCILRMKRFCCQLRPSCRRLSTALSLLSSLQYLSCLTTSRSLTDKLAFDVGLQEDSTGTFSFFRTSAFLECYAERAAGFQARPAGGPSTPPPSRGLRARRSEWVMTSSLSAFPQRDIW